MINHFLVTMRSQGKMKEFLNGYQMYGCLAAMMKTETAQWLHDNIRSPLSQNIIFDKQNQKFIWEINSFDELLSDEIAEILQKNKEFHAQKADMYFSTESIRHEQIKGFADIRPLSAKLMEEKYISLDFLTTTALKKNGAFLVFPDMEMILRNWWNSWNMIFPDTPFDDEDAFLLLVKGTFISSYHISSSVYRMKGNDIRGFYGNMIIGNRLSHPMKELLHALMVMSEYSGTGVKTTLGMGKTCISIASVK